MRNSRSTTTTAFLSVLASFQAGLPLIEGSQSHPKGNIYDHIYVEEHFLNNNGSESIMPTLSPLPTISPAPTVNPTTNSTDDDSGSELPTIAPSNATVSPAPTISPAPTSAHNASESPAPSISPAPTAESSGNHTSESPTPAPSSNGTGTVPPTVDPTIAPTPQSTDSNDDDDHEHKHNHKHKHMSFLRIVSKTIFYLILMGFALLGFGACMSNRYRIYYYARNAWYAFLRWQGTQWLIEKLRLDRLFGESIRNPHDYSSLNDIIFDDDHGFLMSET